jgi:hypothetical protein
LIEGEVLTKRSQDDDMVSTRRSTANAESATNGTKKSQYIPLTNDTINILRPGSKKLGPAPVTPKVSGIALKTAPSGNISDHDLSLTSPFTDENSNVAMTTPRKQQDSPNLHERTVSSALRRLASKPFGNMSGSLHNPIVLNENSSPPRPAVRTPKQKHRHRKIPEPHKFIDQGYGDVYSYLVARAPLAALAMPANGSTFTGHQSHDIYRMMNAKMVAAPGFSPNAAWGRDSLNVPFQVQYPISAQYLAQQQQQQQARSVHISPYAQYYQHQAPPSAYPMVPSQNEDMLRKKAAQYIREVSRPASRKRRLSDADPDVTSVDEDETPKVVVRIPASKKTPVAKTPPQSALMALWGAYYPESPQKEGKTVVYKAPDSSETLQMKGQPVVHRDPESSERPQKKAKPVVYQDPDPIFDPNHLIEHTSLITSLLRIYPQSKDQKGLREDISSMMNVQNQRMTEWMKAESQASRKRKKPNDDSASREVQAAAASAAKAQNEQDSALRNVLSANADMWQDGTGDGVADVFATEPASSLIASVTANVPSQSIEVADSLEKTGSPDGNRHARTGAKVTARDSNASIPSGGGISLIVEAARLTELSKTHNSTPASPIGKLADAVQKASSPICKPATQGTQLSSLVIEQSPRSNSKASTPGNKDNTTDNEFPVTETTSQPTNKLLTPSHKLSAPISKRLSSRKPTSSSRANKLHLASNEVPSSRDVTPTPSSSCLHSESSEPDQIRRPIFRFERKVTVENPAPTPMLQRQETTESMQKVDAEYHVLTKEYLEVQVLGK